MGPLLEDELDEEPEDELDEEPEDELEELEEDPPEEELEELEEVTWQQVRVLGQPAPLASVTAQDVSHIPVIVWPF